VTLGLGEPVLRGKVRDVYAAGDDRLLLVASDRMSAFDVVLPTAIPDKGRVLTGLTLHWLGVMADIVPNHLLGAYPDELPVEARTPELAGRTTLVRRLEMLPIECVVRGYLAGSGLADYRTTGAIGGHRLPAGLVIGSRLPEPIFTPASKASSGHDENIDLARAEALVGDARLAEVTRSSLRIYERAARHCEARGILLADTKFEFGLDGDGRLVLADEVLTPDSSRFWAASRHAPGQSPASFDKQFVRDYLETLDWPKTAPGPELPPDVVAGTTARYRAAYAALVGREFDTYLTAMGVLQ
jgi:phosphoribosylaminoimidazole-succinocarboxamide synthase